LYPGLQFCVGFPVFSGAKKDERLKGKERRNVYEMAAALLHGRNARKTDDASP